MVTSDALDNEPSGLEDDNGFCKEITFPVVSNLCFTYRWDFVDHIVVLRVLVTLLKEAPDKVGFLGVPSNDFISPALLNLYH